MAARDAPLFADCAARPLTTRGQRPRSAHHHQPVAWANAYRLSTIIHADKIVVLDHGRIVETGAHAELLEKRGRYFELYTMAFVDREASLHRAEASQRKAGTTRPGV